MNKATLISVAVCAGLLYGGYELLLSDDGADAQRGKEDPGLLFDRVWVDSTPEKYTDYVHALLVIDDAPFGIFQKASAYRVEAELFEYQRKEQKLALRFPQTDKSAKLGFSISRCDDLPPFDLCLHLKKNPWGGPKTYYSFRDGDHSLADLRHRLLHELEAAPPPQK